MSERLTDEDIDAWLVICGQQARASSTYTSIDYRVLRGLLSGVRERRAAEKIERECKVPHPSAAAP